MLTLCLLFQFTYINYELCSVVNIMSAKRYDWKAVQAFYDSGHARYECLVKFEMSATAWDAAGKDGRLSLRPRSPREDFFSVRKHRVAALIKHHMRKSGLLKERCALCGIKDWMGKPLVLQIDHENGDHADNRPENIRELCPNCHSQTPTYCTRNRKVRKYPPLTHELAKSMYKSGKSVLSVASELGISPETVSSMVNPKFRPRYT